MKTNPNIDSKIESTLNALDNVQEVKVSPFFKDKTMQRLFTKKEDVTSTSIFTWFTPRLQLAALVCVLAVNVYAITQINNSSYDEQISSFATDYGLLIESESSLFNL